MLFGDDALYYQIVKDAHDPDPAVAWRHVPFRRVPARTVPQVAPAPDVAIIADRLNVGLRALLQRVRPRPLDDGALCRVAACC